MNQNKYKGLFITFEGCEGTGKTTHMKALVPFLQEQGFDVVQTREPGGTRISEQIRMTLLDNENDAMTATTELLLYQASRAQLTDEIIIPALEQGKIVICDRYQDATFAYQGYGAGVDISLIDYIAKIPNASIMPDLTILMDLEVEQGLQRSVCKDRMDQKSLDFHKKVRTGYLDIASKSSDRMKVIHVQDDYERNQARIREIVLNVITQHTCK